MPILTKLNSIRNPFTSSKHHSAPPTARAPSHQPYASSPYSRSSLSASNLTQHHHNHQPCQLKQSPMAQEPRQRVASTPTASFAETLKVISKQVQQDQFEDVFGSFFFTEKRCQHRATFMTARLLQNLVHIDLTHYYRQQRQQQTLDPFWKTLIDRFYTLNYLLFVVPSNSTARATYLMALEQRMKNDPVGQHLQDRRGGLETYFALYYAMMMAPQQQQQQDISNDVYVVQQACKILAHCLDSESKLGHSERDAMYIFHSLRAGLHGHYDDGDAKVILDDDDLLLALIDETVQNNKNLASHPYVNPFEDDACIVDDSDDDNCATGIEL